MYIGGYHGYNFDRTSTDMPDYGIFLQMEWGTVTADDVLQVGNLVAFSTTDNTAQAGILRETRGLRAILYPTLGAATVATVHAAGVSLTSVAALPNPETYAAKRGPLIVVQAYGPNALLRANTDATGNIIVGGAILPSPDAAGTFNGPATEGTVTQVEINKVVGFSFEVVAINTTTTFKGFVNCLNVTM